jgi:hypothetical protein
VGYVNGKVKRRGSDWFSGTRAATFPEVVGYIADGMAFVAGVVAVSTPPPVDILAGITALTMASIGAGIHIGMTVNHNQSTSHTSTSQDGATAGEAGGGSTAAK